MVRLYQQLDQAGRAAFAVAEITHLAEPRIVVVVRVVGTYPMTAGAAVKRDRVVLPSRKTAGHRIAARPERARVDDVEAVMCSVRRVLHEEHSPLASGKGGRTVFHRVFVRKHRLVAA